MGPQPQTVSKADALAEAYKRGLLPPEKKAAYEEAQRRGLLKSAAPSLRSETDAIIEEAAAASPGGYEAFAAKPADPQRMAAMGYVADPLAKSGYARPQAPQPRVEAPPSAPADDRWEAPSFLRRPAPAPAEAIPVDVEAEPVAAPKRKYERRPRKDAAADPSGSDATKEPAAD
jgi:hypothetical protein